MTRCQVNGAEQYERSIKQEQDKNNTVVLHYKRRESGVFVRQDWQDIFWQDSQDLQDKNRFCILKIL